MKRWPQISVEKPESLSAGKATGMNEQVLSNWFDMYAKTLEELGKAGTYMEYRRKQVAGSLHQ